MSARKGVVITTPNPAEADSGWIVAKITTDNATPTALAVIDTDANYSYLVIAHVVATETVDHDETAGYVRMATFKNDGGTLALVGSVTADHTAESTGGWDCSLDANDDDIRLLVTGAEPTNINWKAEIKVIKVT